MLASVTEETASIEMEHLFLLATAASALKCVLVHLSSLLLNCVCGLLQVWRLHGEKGVATGEQVTISGTDGGGGRRGESTVPTFTCVRAGHPL